MPDAVDALILDLLEWIGPAGRPYSEVIDAWRTSCPRLPVWEEANDRGLIDRSTVCASEPIVTVTTRGAEFHRAHRRVP